MVYVIIKLFCQLILFVWYSMLLLLCKNSVDFFLRIYIRIVMRFSDLFLVVQLEDGKVKVGLGGNF